MSITSQGTKNKHNSVHDKDQEKKSPQIKESLSARLLNT